MVAIITKRVEVQSVDNTILIEFEYQGKEYWVTVKREPKAEGWAELVLKTNAPEDLSREVLLEYIQTVIERHVI